MSESHSEPSYDELRERNRALAQSLRRASQELERIKDQLTHLAQPPMRFATIVRVHEVMQDASGLRRASVEVSLGGTRMVVPVAADVPLGHVRVGDVALLNDAMTAVATRGADEVGVLRRVRQLMEDGRMVVTDGSGNATLVHAIDKVRAQVQVGDEVLVDVGAACALSIVPKADGDDLVLEQVPDVSFDDIGGLDVQIERIHDAVQLPFLHRELYERFGLRAPKGVLLYGPPGNGKTMIAKAVAHALAQGSGRRGVFLSVKGPELLNKFVGESERLIRSLFARARERAAAGNPVIVFIDEMDSLLRMRGSGVSSDMETTIVPQFLAEMDGVEGLDNVVVIGASNRVDMIDPAVLRPGRLDVKIHVDRPNRNQAKAIVARYVTDALPIASGLSAHDMGEALVEAAYARDSERAICQVRDDQGTWSTVYLRDVISGAMLRNMVDRAKTAAVKASIEAGGDVALDTAMMREAVRRECVESRASIAQADPAQWSRTAGVRVGEINAIRACS